MDDLLTKQRGEVRGRLDGLRAESIHLELADAALAGASAEAIAQARSTLGLDRGPAPKRPTGKRRRRPAKRGERAAQVLAAVRAHPDGITAPELAKELRVQSTYVYRPLGVLVEQGEIKKDGAKFVPVSAA